MSEQSISQKLTPKQIHHQRYKTDEERFWEKIEKTSTCWLWRGNTNWFGHGIFWADEFRWKAHRYMWKLIYKNIPPRMHVLHHCDIAACVNPQHLYTGSQKDNIRDCIKRNRRNTPIGEKAKQAILTEEDVYKIRQLAADGNPILQISKLYKCSEGAIDGIVRRKNWKHLN